MYRHGDLLLREVKKTPGLVSVQKTKSYVLAYGEVTGHKHLLQTKTKSFGVWEDKDGMFYLDMPEAGSLTHEEHKKLVIAPGFYQIVHEREYDPFTEEMRQVVD